MRAATVDHYGPPEVIQIREHDRPRPKKGELLVRVRAAAVTSADARLRAGRFPRGLGTLAKLATGWSGPRTQIPGSVLAGEVVEGGPNIHRDLRGARIAGMTGLALGAHAEYAVIRETACAEIPDGISDTDAAASLFGATTALYFLRDLQPRMRVLVNGAAGSVGSAAVQIARNAGAEVTAVSRYEHHELLNALGADHVHDYEATPVCERDDQFDLVLDTVGNLERNTGLALVSPGGRLLMPVAGLGDMIRPSRRIMTGAAPERSSEMAQVLDAVARGWFAPLAEMMGGLDALADAHRRIDTGHKRGNLVIEP